jgi:hypothetical protein
MLVLLLAVFAVTPKLVAQQQMAVKAVGTRTCTDIRSVDFSNLKFESAGMVFAFHKGKAYSWDCRDCADRDKPDWGAKIEQDKIISPAPGIRIRFLLVENNHLTGTGAWYHVVGFRCEPTGSQNRGRLLKVFDRNGMSLQLESIDNQGVTLTTATVPGKPIVEHFTYKWDNDTSQFVLDKTRTTQMQVP